jgi:polyphosphate kinase 2 (PPK2 family)
VAQFDVGMDGVLAPKATPTVAAGTNPEGIAVTPLTREPTKTEQCKHGGWRYFARFADQGECVAFVTDQARSGCLAERASLGRVAFDQKYGEGRKHRHALRRCLDVTVS